MTRIYVHPNRRSLASLKTAASSRFLERIPVMFEHSRHGERSFCILAG